MPNYEAPHQSPGAHDPGVNLLSVFKAIVGTILIAIGVILGVYTAIAVIGIVNGEEPPGIVAKFLESSQQAVTNKVEHEVRIVDLSDDGKRLVLLGISFFLLLLPIVVATNMITAGVRLMQNDASEAIQQIATHLKQKP